jgi:hypothetical protein
MTYKICPECREVTAKAIDRVAGNTKDYDYYDYLVRRGAERISALVRALPAREPVTEERIKQLAEQAEEEIYLSNKETWTEACMWAIRRALEEERGE